MPIQLNDLLLILLYESLIILVIVLIILAIKLIKTLKKVNTMVDGVNKKLEQLDSTFEIIDTASTFTTSLASKVLDVILGIFKKDKKGNDSDE